MINMCLTSKTAGHDRPRHPVLQILWGIIHRFNIDYAERIWEEFVQSIQTFLTDKKRLTITSRGKKKSTPLLIPSIRFTKLIIHHLNTKHNIHQRTGSPLHYSHDDNVIGNLKFVVKDGRDVFGMPIPDALLTDAIKRAPYYDGYLAHVVKYQQHLDGEHGMAEKGAVPESPAPKATNVTKPAGDKTPKPTSSQPPKPTPAPTKPSKAVPEKKQKLVKETHDEPSPAKRSKAGLVGKMRKPKSLLKLVDELVDEGVPMSEPKIVDEEADYQRAVELSLKDLEAKTQGPARTVVIREPDSGRFQPVQETPKQKSPADQFIFQRHTPTTTEPSRNAESPSLDDELAIADSEMKSDEKVTPVNKEKDASNKELTMINAGVQDEGQAGSDPGKKDKGQARSNPGNVAVFQPQPSHVVHAGPNLKPMDLAVSDSSTQQNPEHLDEEFTTNAYPNVQENLKLPNEDQFFMEKPQEEDPEKTNAESEVQSMVIVPLHQDTSSVPPMTTPVTDLTTSQSDSKCSCSTPNINNNNHNNHNNNNSSTTTSTTTKHHISNFITTYK
ncbi:retrovirus-related pol polyprotein from transposon TNT 1-94 [Tanacetum coccineum]